MPLYRSLSILFVLLPFKSQLGKLKALSLLPSTMLPIDTLLSDAQVAIENALNNPDILNALKDYGYTTTRIQQGKALYNVAAAAQLAQTAEA